MSIVIKAFCQTLIRQTNLASIRTNPLLASSYRVMSSSEAGGETNPNNMGLYSADYISEKLKSNLDAQHIEVEDLSGCCGMKFNALIVSPKFDGKTVLARQRLVNSVLVEEMKTIHAFTMKTLTPEQWQNINKSN